MSQENVEIVRRVYDAVSRRAAETVFALYDPEIEWDMTHHPYADLMERRVYHGHEGLRTFWREWYEAWENYEDIVEELIDAGEHVIAVATTRARGRASGVTMERGWGGVFTIRKGKIIRVAWFLTRAEALEAVGLRE